MSKTDYVNALWRPSPNYWASRQGFDAQYIVAHGTAGLMPGCLNWLTSTQSGASVHYLVDQTGEVFQLVNERCAAWGNGIPESPSSFVGQANPNLYTISAEAERDPTNSSPITAVQKAALINLFSDIRARHGPLPIIPHSAISPQSREHCPGDGYPLAEIDRASAHPGPSDITWIRFSGTPQKTPLVFYKDASFKTPLYTSAASSRTLLNFDGWRYGVPVMDVIAKQKDRRWFHRNNPKGEQGWTPSAFINGNPEGSTP